MSIESLPSPFEIAGGRNPYYSPAGNIAGLAGAPRPDQPGDYDRYLQDTTPFLGGIDDVLSGGAWPVVLSTMTYGYVRQGGLLGIALGLLGGTFFPRTTVVLYAIDAAMAGRSRAPMLRRA